MKSKHKFTLNMFLKSTESQILSNEINLYKNNSNKYHFMDFIDLSNHFQKILKLKNTKLKKLLVLAADHFLSDLLNLLSVKKINKTVYSKKLVLIKNYYKFFTLESHFIEYETSSWMINFLKNKNVDFWLPSLKENLNLRGIKNNSWFNSIEISNIANFKNLSTIKSTLKLESNDVVIKAKKENREKKKIVNEAGVPNGILKVKLYPTEEQKKVLKLFMYGNIWAWNTLISESFKYGGPLKMTSNQIDEIENLIKKGNVDPNLKIHQCQDEIFNSAYRDFKKAINSTKKATKALKNKTGKGFKYPQKLKFKKKKDKKGSIELKPKSLKYNAVNNTISFHKRCWRGLNNNIKMKTDLNKLGVKILFSCRLIQYDEEFFLNIPYRRLFDNEDLSNRLEKCALDPGVRTFMTGYTDEGYAFELSNDLKKINAKKKRLDLLESKLSTSKFKKKKKKYRKEIKYLYKKIRNSINDMHHKTSKLLSQNFKKILLPKFETQKMVIKKDHNRKINNKTARDMNILSHYKFKELLKHKMMVRKGILIECTEEYTSKTCGNCGIHNPNLGSKKVFECPNCKMSFDRDINAARNILIKNLHLL